MSLFTEGRLAGPLQTPGGDASLTTGEWMRHMYLDALSAPSLPSFLPSLEALTFDLRKKPLASESSHQKASGGNMQAAGWRMQTVPDIQ